MSSSSLMSLFIPHVFGNIDKEFIMEVFREHQLGNVKSIDFVSKLGKDGHEFNAAYIHMESWETGKAARDFKALVVNQDKEARLIYEEPWYWIVLENTARKVVSGDRKPCLDLGSAKPKAKLCFETDNFPALSSAKVLPRAPTLSYVASKKIEDILTPEFMRQTAAEIEEELQFEAEMDEIEALMDEEDSRYAEFDINYVQQLEEENMAFSAQVNYLNNALAAEQVKSQTLADTLSNLMELLSNKKK